MIVVDQLRPFARGGTAELFSATADGARVIVKLAREGALPGALAAEASVLERLSSHVAPRLFGTTRIANREGLVLEHVAMPTLATARASLGDHRLAIAAAICDAVASVHDAGFVHGDLTPTNILVDVESARVWLIDFGVAAEIGARLPALATIRYAAPERVAAECCASPSIDVYALGVICFEILTGEAPFVGDAGAARVAHAAHRVTQLSERLVVGAALDAIVARAMAKPAAARPSVHELAAVLRGSALPRGLANLPRAIVGDEPRRRATLVGFSWRAGAPAVRVLAEEVGAVVAHSDGDRHVLALWSSDVAQRARVLETKLHRIGATDVAAREATVQIDPRGTPRAAAIVALARGEAEPTHGATHAPATAPLVGRDSALDVIAAAARAATGGETTLVTIVGAAGLGKSRLARSIIDQQRGGVEVIELHAHTVAAALDALGDEPTSDDADQAALSVVAGTRSLAGSPAAHLASAPGALRQAAARALARKITGDGSPRMVIADDAHAADPIVLDALELATIERGARLLAVVLARPTLTLTRMHWARRATRSEHVTLAPLDRDAGRRLVRALLPEHAAVPAVAIDRLVERCGGVPLYICELVAALCRADRRRGATGSATRGALPTDLIELPPDAAIVQWTVDDELSLLSSGARAAAEALSLLDAGITVTRTEHAFAALARAALGNILDTGVAIRELCAAGLLHAGGDRLAFRHGLVREAVAQGIAAQRRQALHRALYEIATTDEDRARHAEGCGERAIAAQAWDAVARAAHARHDDLKEELAIDRAIACRAESVPDLVRRRGAARARLGRHDAAAADFATARELAQSYVDRATLLEVLLDEATALDWALHHDASAARVRDAAALIGDGDSTLLHARLAMAIGRSAWRAGNAAAAIEPCKRALAIADTLADEGYQTAIACRLMLAFILGGAGKIDEAAQFLDDALAFATSRGDLIHIAAARCNRYPVHAARGDAAALRADLAAFTAAGRALGNAVTEYRGELYQALVATWTADDENAHDRALAAQRLELLDPALFPRPRATLLLAELAARRGDRNEAATWCQRARDAGATHPSDAIMLDGVAAWLTDRLDLTTGRELAARAIAAGEAEAAFQLLELTARAGDAETTERARLEARALPCLPRFMTGESR